MRSVRADTPTLAPRCIEGMSLWIRVYYVILLIGIHILRMYTQYQRRGIS